ncbi:hypothetical protein KFL_014220010, partial [Klebsormidium nitens]
HGRQRAPCFVCGDTGHLGAQYSKRVVPSAVAAPAPRATQSVSSAEFAEFQAWKMSAQAATAVGASDEEEEGSEWDDQEYELGAVALPLGTPGVVMAAAGTKEGAHKARATRAARARGPAKEGPGGEETKGAAGSAVGTAQIAGPVNIAAAEALKARRDKAAAKERLVKLPDHGRQVAPQGLNRLPKGFKVKEAGPAGNAPHGQRAAAAEGVMPNTTRRAVTGATNQVGQAASRCEQPGLVGHGSLVSGEVRLPVALFLDLAEKAGLDLATVASLTRDGQVLGGELPARVRAGRALSPIALKARRAREERAAEETGERHEAMVGPVAQPALAGSAARAEKGREQEDQAREVAFADAIAWADAAEAEEQPESSAMGAARMRRRAGGERQGADADAELARAMAEEEEEGARAAYRARAAAVDEDARVARELVAQEARKRGVDQAAAMRAQDPQGATGGAAAGAPAAGAPKGKGKVQQGDPPLVQVLAWEKKLSTGAWRGAAQLAEVVVTPKEDVVVAAATRAQAMACFAEGRPLVSPSEREHVEGVPDWVDNATKVVKVMTTKGWWAPDRVLLDGGSFYSMAGARLKARLGLTEADMDTGGHRVQTAMGKVEVLPGGLTKEPVPIVLNPGTAEELCLLEKLAFTGSTGYDLLIGTRAAYPAGLSVDRWTEEGVYRVNWRTEGDKEGGVTRSEGEGAAKETLSPVERVGRRLATRWPRGPQIDIAAEAKRAVSAAVGTQRRKPGKPPQGAIPQLAGCKPLDQRLVPALPGDRPLRVLELFAGVGSATQALARLGYELGEFIACEARGAARVVHAHALSELAREFPQTVRGRAGAQLHHRFPQDIRLITSQALRELGPIDLVVAG